MPEKHRTAFPADAECRTQRSLAREGVVSAEMARVAEREHLAPEAIRDEVAAGRMIIPANVNHRRLDPMAIGLKARVKINANIGSSPTTSDIDEEVEKLDLAERWGADTVMDLSTGKRIDDTREAMLAAATVPIGTVPIYQALERVKRIEDLTAEILLDDDRPPGPPGRRLHDDPRRHAARPPAALPPPGDRDRLPRRRRPRPLDGPPRAREPAVRGVRRDPRHLPPPTTSRSRSATGCGRARSPTRATPPSSPSCAPWAS